MRTSPLYDAGALLAGGAVGGVLVSLEWTLVVFVEALVKRAPASEMVLVLAMPLLVGFYALPGFMIAMSVLGWPVWALLHTVGFRSQKVALVAGAASALIASVAIMAVQSDWTITGLTWLVLPGAAASWTVWRLAYRQTAKPPPGSPKAAP